MSVSFGDPNFGQLAGFEENKRSRALRVTLWIFIILVVLLFVALIVWIVWYRPSGIGFGEFLGSILSQILRVLLWPIRFLLGLFGFYDEEGPLPGVNLPPVPLPPALKPTSSTTITKHEIATCPPCEVDVQCPPCEDVSSEIKPLELEIQYLKDMVRFVGSIAKRENAINAQYKELYPGFNVLSPHVRKLSHEYNYIKDEIRKDKDKWQYFKNYFTKLTNIPSTTSAIHYDVLLD